MNQCSAFLAAVVLLASGAAAAAAPDYDTDYAGGKDSPLISRFKGSTLFMYGDESAGSARVVGTNKGKPVLLPVEGRIANRVYWSPRGASPLEVHRNYRQALAAGGYEIVYECEELRCKADNTQDLVHNLPREVKWREFHPMVQGIFNSGNRPGFHLVSARKAAGQGYVYVQVALAQGSSDKPYVGRVQQFVQVVEPTTIETGKVTVDARAIGEGLKRDGKIALYGVNFDFNKAVLREDSAAQLAEMANALKAAPALKVFIVGHTDNQGDFESNLALSQRRAQAVAEALSSKYGIAAARMTARGVANLAPVASNGDEPGRARNRRVELVVR
ncbi:OmpA family protein [Massilia arenosa]|uniref:OmpA family protein n=1 Tax=Zemynaea arenosa TaxID=2561931 RepID=A0A4Y9SA44_9BURK|nr:OmpA family protein [Massilia arenosa]TFW18456.1 OmpA family protein [Massilia arenosa]